MKKRLLLFFIIVFFGIAFYLNLTREIKVRDIGDFKEENLIPSPEKKQIIGNITVINLEGTAYEIGYQNGVLVKEEINEILDEAFSQYLPGKSLKSRLVRLFIFGLVKKIDKEIPDEYRQEMQGVADGAGRSYDDILLMNTFIDGFESLNPLLLQSILDATGISRGCSGIIVQKGEKAENLIIGQTVDYPMALGAKYSVLYIISKTNKKIIYLPSFPGIVLPINGMNEEGMVLTQRDTPTGKGKIGVPTGVIARLFLEEGKDLDDARKYLNKVDWSISRSILIADSSNNLSSFIEVLPGEDVKEIKIDGYAGAANHYKKEEFFEAQKNALDKCRRLKFICQYEKYANAFRGSLKREKFLEDFVKEEKWITTDEIARSISDYTPGLSNGLGGMTVANEFTQQAVIFVPKKNEIYMANGKTPPVTQEGFVRIKLK